MLQVLKEVRDSIETVHMSVYHNFLKYLFLPLLDIIRQTECQFVQNEIQQLRVVTLEILYRLPSVEVPPFCFHVFLDVFHVFVCSLHVFACFCMFFVCSLHVFVCFYMCVYMCVYMFLHHFNLLTFFSF